MKNGLPPLSRAQTAATLLLHLVSGQGGKETGQRLDIELLEAQVVIAGLAGPGVERVGERVGLIEVDVAVGPDHGDPLAAGEAGQMAEHGHRAPVGPVQVVEEDEEWGPARAGDQELRHPVEEAVALFFGGHGHAASISGRTSRRLGTS